MNTEPWAPLDVRRVPRQIDIEKQGLRPEEITLAEMLKKAGYRTACVGKWHLGDADFAKPGKRGFDEHYGFYNSHSLYAYENTEGIVDQRISEDWTDQFIWASQRDGASAIVHNDTVIIENEYLTDRIAVESIRFIESNKDTSFFLYVPFSSPHTPLQVHEDLYHKYAHISDPYKRTYNAMIDNLDQAVGRILEKVSDAGIEDNTLIIFLSDNGGATYTHTTDNAPLKGGKITHFEGGVRVPMIMKWTGQIPEGVVFEEPVSSLDVFATVSSAARLALPDDRKYDGVDLVPHILSESVSTPHQTLFWEVGTNCMVIDRGWKLIFRNDAQGHQALFNLQSDPYEKINLIDSHPEKTREIMEKYQGWAGEMQPPMWPPVVSYKYQDETGTYKFVN